MANASSDCSLFAQSFIQVGLDGIQEVWCVDIMFIQLTPARSQCRGYICNKLENLLTRKKKEEEKKDFLKTGHTYNTKQNFTKCYLTWPSHGCNRQGPWSSHRFPPFPHRLFLTSGRTWRATTQSDNLLERKMIWAYVTWINDTK